MTDISTTCEVVIFFFTLKMTTAQVVETSVTVNNNSPIQDYVHPDDQTQSTFEMTPGFKPFIILNQLAHFMPYACSWKVTSALSIIILLLYAILCSINMQNLESLKVYRTKQ